MTAYWTGFKVVVKTDNAMDFGAGQVEAFGNGWNCGIRHIAYVALNGMQQWQERAGQVFDIDLLSH